MRRALELDPLPPAINTQVAISFFVASEMERAIDAYRRALARFPGFEEALYGLGRCLLVRGAYEEAMEQIRLAHPARNQGLLGMAHGLLGERAEAREILAGLSAKSRESYVQATEYALVYIGLGDNEQALGWLERACEERGMFVAWMKTWPLYDSLRDEPRFQELVRRMSFPD